MLRTVLSALFVLAGVVAFMLMFAVEGGGFLELTNVVRYALAAISLLLMIVGVLIWKHKAQASRKIKAALIAAIVIIVFAGVYMANYGTNEPARELTMEEVLENEPCITGTVTEVEDRYLYLECEPTPQIPTTDYRISLDVEVKDSMTEFHVGDEVVVYYDGNIAETAPLEINKVYAITLKTPAEGK